MLPLAVNSETAIIDAAECGAGDWSSLLSPEGGVLSEGGSAVVRGEVHPEHHGVLAVAGHLTGLGAAQLQAGSV